MAIQRQAKALIPFSFERGDDYIMTDGATINITSEVRSRRVYERSNDQMSNKVRKLQREALKDGMIVTDWLQNETILKTAEAQQFADPFGPLYVSGTGADSAGEMQIIEPMNNPQVMKRIPTENNILLQCIEAMVLNVEGTGYILEYVGDKADGIQEGQKSQAEYSRLKAFLESPNEEYPLIELRKRVRRDRETFGYGFMEVVRDTSGIVHSIYHVPANTMRLTAPEKETTHVAYKVLRGDVYVTIMRAKRWRRFVQMQNGNSSQRIYFKEFGDQRIISDKDGKVGINVPLENRATEIIMFSDYKSGELYGYPRWCNQIPAVLGSREAELVNLDFFKDNAIPQLAVLVSGGYLSTDTVDAIATKFHQGRGRKKMNQVLILEATGDEVAAKVDGQIPVPRLEIKPLSTDRQKDGLFLEYDDKCRDKIRCSFRIAPVLLGLTVDYNRATADASIVVCESQVFQPERKDVDDLFNKYILGDGVNMPRFWRIKSNPTRIVDQADIADSIQTLEASGALTPNVVISVTNSMFGLDIKPIEESWGDFPYSMILALIAQKVPLQGLDDLIDKLEIASQQQAQADAKVAAQDAKNAPKGTDNQQQPKQKVMNSIRNVTTKLKQAAGLEEHGIIDA